MENIWIKAIKTTGAVGVVGFLLSFLINHLFNEKIVEALGSERLFFAIVLIICGLVIALMLAISKEKNNKEKSDTPNSNSSNKKIEISYGNQSTHNGDNNF